MVTPDKPEVEFSIPGLGKEASLLPDLDEAGNVGGGVAYVLAMERRRRGETVVVITLALVESIGGCFIQLRKNFLNFLSGSRILAVCGLGDVDIVSLSGVQIMPTPCLNTP